MPTVKLAEQVAFSTLKFINSIPREKLVKVDGSDYKAVTMKRKIATILETALASFKEKLGKLEAAIKVAQTEMKAHSDEIDATGATDDEKKAEKDVYAIEINKRLSDDITALGTMIAVKPEVGNSYFTLKTDEELIIELEDRHMAFLKEQLTISGLSAYDIDDEFLAAGEAFGLEA